jgi:hypothetical protein
MIMAMRHALPLMFVIFLFAGCGARNTPSKVQSPGGDKTAKSHMLEHGAEMLQAMPPVSQINMYLDGFHFYADDMGRQVEAHHYCTHVNEDFHQCIIFDGNAKGAKLIGIEYIISEKLFKQLPEDEKKLWHSHHYEVKSGQLVMPGIPGAVEKEAMEKLVTTYGKTWHTWQIDRGDTLPLGIPQLMMGFTADGQGDPKMAAARDKRMDIWSEKKRAERESIPMPTVQPGANSWQGGRTLQLKADTVDVKNLRATTRPVSPSSTK